MISIWFVTMASILVVSLISLVGIITFGVRSDLVKRATSFFVAIAVGALFGDVFIHLIPEIFAIGSNTTAMATYSLVGIGIFFVLEKFLRWRHTHDTHQCDNEQCRAELVKPLGQIVLVGDGMHNLIDGLIIGASFLVSVPAGIATTIAVALHEIPQEISDFGVLLHAGYTKSKALLYNFLSALIALLGGAVALVVGTKIDSFTTAVVAVAIGGFIYIAGSDLVPELNGTNSPKQAIMQFIGILIGVAAMFALLLIE